MHVRLVAGGGAVVRRLRRRLSQEPRPFWFPTLPTTTTSSTTPTPTAPNRHYYQQHQHHHHHHYHPLLAARLYRTTTATTIMASSITTASSSPPPPADNSTNNDEFLERIVRVSDNTSSSSVKFAAEPHRYVLYVTAGCPFAARPWLVQALYGLPVHVVALFPAAHDDGWFFTAQSQGERDLVTSFPTARTDHCDPWHKTDTTTKVHHLKQLYLQTNPKFTGAISVPLLWDTKHDTAVNNSSLQVAELLATHLEPTRNRDITLFPLGEKQREEHLALVQELHTNITTAVYRILGTPQDGTKRDAMIDEFYDHLTHYQERLEQTGGFLMGRHSLHFGDLVLFITLIRLDIGYSWRFGLGERSVRENYPGLWQYVQRILQMPGVAETVWPRDIMAMYFMGTKWNHNGQGRNVPKVPLSWLDELPMLLKQPPPPPNNTTHPTPPPSHGPKHPVDDDNDDDDDDDEPPSKQAKTES